MPSRKTITALIFFSFIIFFFGLVIMYFGSTFFASQRTADVDGTGESRGFTFFPFGRGGGDTTTTPFVPVDPGDTTTQNPNTGGDNSGEVIINRLRQISTTPTAGGYVYTRVEQDDSLFSSVPENIDVITFVEASTGHVYETQGDSNQVSRLTNTTIPRIFDAEFIDGNQVLLRYIDQTSGEIKTFSADVISPEDNTRLESEDVTNNGRLSGIFLQDGINNIDVSQETVLYSVIDNERFSLRRTDTNGNEIVEIFNSPLTQWHINAYGTNDVMLTHVPSFNSYGFAQTLDIPTTSLQKRYSGELALQYVPNQSGDRALVSYWDGREMSLFVQDADGLRDTGLDTFAEKCVWSSDNIFAYCAEPLNDIAFGAPDSWYKGLEQYSDDVYQVNTERNTTSLLFSPFEEGQFALDLTEVALSANEKFLSFIDKGTQTFWTYQLEL